MAWWKEHVVSRIRHYPGSMEVEKYVYTPGIHGLELAKALKEGRIIGTRCGDKVYVPPTTLCPDHKPGEPVEVKGSWRVVTYTIITETMEGEKLEEPEVLAVLKPEDAEGGLVHRVKADQIYIGMEVQPVFRPPEERKGTIDDILYFTAP